MSSEFRTYESAIRFAKACRKITIADDLKDQLNRASASIALNLSEGSAGSTQKERHRFYVIALRSFREVQAIFRIADIAEPEVSSIANQPGAQLYRLCQATQSKKYHPRA